MNRIKYWLLRWLLNDICQRSDCESCGLAGIGGYCSPDGEPWNVCFENDVFVQARKVWRIGE